MGWVSHLPLYPSRPTKKLKRVVSQIWAPFRVSRSRKLEVLISRSFGQVRSSFCISFPVFQTASIQEAVLRLKRSLANQCSNEFGEFPPQHGVVKN